MIAYPDGLPPPIQDGYAFTPTNKIRRTDMDSGRARQRIEFDSVPTFVTVTWLLTDPQATLLDAWADQVAGVDWFQFPIWTPLYYEQEEVRFTQSLTGPVPIMGSDRWTYSAQLEVRFKPQAQDGYAALMPDYLLLADIFDITMNQTWSQG